FASSAAIARSTPNATSQIPSIIRHIATINPPVLSCASKLLFQISASKTNTGLTAKPCSRHKKRSGRL
ncbi:MAG: hypothetical protein R3204_11005, partial [Oceanospirillum sp.]|nr:hypothetical protein [Oceanospirillum sp.]